MDSIEFTHTGVFHDNHHHLEPHPRAPPLPRGLGHLGKTEADDEPLPFSVIVTSNGLDDALWCCRAEPGHGREWRLFAVWCVRQVQHLLTDPRSIAALDVAERYANGAATHDELVAAGVAARDAARRARRGAPWVAAGVAQEVAAWAAVEVAAWGAVGASPRAQLARFLEIVG